VKIAVWGFGRMGQRYSEILKNLGSDVAVISRRGPFNDRLFPDWTECKKSFQPEIVFVCNETHLHTEVLEILNRDKFQGYVVVEKPLGIQPPKVDSDFSKRIFVAYNLRFLNLIQTLKVEINNQPIIQAMLYVGQYLPQWRSDADYRKFYSADRSRGGGVLTDLSHELDLSLYLLGSFQSVFASGGKLSDLEITSDDVYSLICKTGRCPNVSIHLNYLDRKAKRFIRINTKDHTYEADLIANTLSVDGEVKNISGDVRQTYTDLAKAAIEKDWSKMCSYNEGQEVMICIDKAQESNKSRAEVRLK
jgi:predicted dehydrogenase